MTVSAGHGFRGWGTITDPVNCQGTIIATSGGAINLTNGLTLSGTGQVNLGSGTLTVNDSASGMTGGSLVASSLTVGSSGTGTFTQSGGTNLVSSDLYLGNAAGSSGTYILSGSGLLSVSTCEYIGYSGSGSFTQSGGTHTVGYLILGDGGSTTYNLCGGLLSASFEGPDTGPTTFTQTGGIHEATILTISGTYSLSGSGLLSAGTEYYGQTSIFTQSGGTHTVGELNLGDGGSGTYNLGGGLLSAGVEYLGWSLYDSGVFTQSGGTHTIGYLNVGDTFGGSGTYNLDGGLLSTGMEYIGGSGIAAFTQTGGTNSVTDLLLLSATYSLSGSGLLSAGTESIAYIGAATNFTQTGGTNTAACVNLAGGRYLLSGGLLQINGGLETAGGTLNCGGGSATIQAGNSIVDLTGCVVNTASTSLVADANSLVIVPSLSTSAEFGVFDNAGITHVLGTTLTVSAGTGFGGCGTITDPVICQGSIIATASGTINLTNGLQLSGTGQVNLGSGALTVNDSASGMTGGSLVAASLTVGSSGTGTFTQSGGTNLAGSIVLGENTGSMGTYNLNGGFLNFAGLSKGSGSAAFNFSGGTLQAASGFSTSLPIVLSTAGSNAVFDVSGSELDLEGDLSGPGGLQEIGTGLLILDGSDSFGGGTTVSGGTLEVLSSSALADGSSLTVGADASEIFAAAGQRTLLADNVQVVPEPSTFRLFAAGVAMLVGYGWRRRNASSAPHRRPNPVQRTEDLQGKGTTKYTKHTKRE